jgi:hypothetical protein
MPVKISECSTGFADTMAHIVGSMIPEVLESPVMASSLATLALH